MSSEMLKIIIEAIATVVISIGMYLFNRYAKPWLKTNNLEAAAMVAVNAAEAMYGRYNGEQKLKAALQKLKDRGFNIDAQEVLDAVHNAWRKMNTQQIAAGEKDIIIH